MDPEVMDVIRELAKLMRHMKAWEKARYVRLLVEELRNPWPPARGGNYSAKTHNEVLDEEFGRYD